MLCENCNKNVATVHLVEIINQQKKEVNLCENCAQEAGLPFSKPNISVSGIFGLIDPQSALSSKRNIDLQCPDCGMSFREFRSKGRFGCAKDYEIFRAPLESLLEKIHGSASHVGQAPHAHSHTIENKKKFRELESLRKRLNQAISKEEYEEAAKLRDRIQVMEEDLKTSPQNEA